MLTILLHVLSKITRYLYTWRLFIQNESIINIKTRGWHNKPVWVTNWTKIHISYLSFIFSIWLLNRQCLLAGTTPVWDEEVDTVSGMARCESREEKKQVDSDTERVSWWCVPRLLFRHSYTLLAGTEILKALMEDSLHGISCFLQSYLAPSWKYSCLKICKIPCLCLILSCRLQLQLMVKPAVLLFRLTLWDEGKNCEMLSFM